jgi:predicted nucleotidyltransferase
MLRGTGFAECRENPYMTPPTAFPELNAVLDEFVASVEAILGENLFGVYLQGSFAVGGADEHSDVDFIVVTDDEVGESQLSELQAMHKRLYGLESSWAQHLEGSYVPKDELRRVDPERREYLYLDNGATELVRDNHCNTAVVRWSLRECGVVLTGPDPRGLVDPIAAQDLRNDVLVSLREWVEWLPGRPVSRRAQSLSVLSLCRILHTLETATVASKREAGEWALAALDPEWAPLIQRALDDRPDPWDKVREPADPNELALTLDFLDYAARRSGL